MRLPDGRRQGRDVQTATATLRGSRLSRTAMQALQPSGLPTGAVGLTTRFTRLGLIDREGTAVELFAVEPLDGGFGGRTVGHFHEAKAFGAPGVTVSNNIDRVYHTMGLEELAKAIIRRTKRKVAYKDIHVQSSSS